MNDNVNEITYNLLQHEYLKRRNVVLSEDNLKNIMKVFPDNWFLLYSIEDRIKIISLALKNNLDIEEVIQNKSQKCM